MKKRFKIIICLAIALICIVPQTGCGGKEPVSGSDFLLNTACSVKIYRAEGNRKEQEALIRETFALCREFENRLSRTVADGDVGKINSARGAVVPVDVTTAEVIRAGLAYGELSEGLFDITVGELSELWNFSGDDPSVPADSLIREAVSHVGYRKVRVMDEAEAKNAGASEGTAAAVQLLDPETKLDLGGIAKGYIADQAAAFLSARGVTSAILDFGGNIICVGEKEDGVPFTIGVEKPFSSDNDGAKGILGSVRARDAALVTSGTYERKFYEDGTLYYHILDPATGYPRDTDIDGVTIMGPDSMSCDGLSTSCLMLGLEKGKALIESLDGYEALFVTKDGRIHTTEGFDFTAEGSGK